MCDALVIPTGRETARRPALVLSTALAVVSAACGEFEVPSIVLDSRVLAIQAEPPEVVVPIDLEALSDAIGDPDALMDVFADLQLSDIEVCALVADPNVSRSLEYTMHACAPTAFRRCDEPDHTLVDIVTAGVIEDPEQAPTPAQACGTLSPSLDLFLALRESFEDDALAGFGGLKLQIQFTVRPPDTPFDEAVFASKRVLFSAEYPAGRQANQNPALDALAMEIDEGVEQPLPLGRCRDIEPTVLGTGESITFVPEEADNAREQYTVATFDGGERTFTENLTYAWYANDGRWQRGVSGGPRDVAGNDPELDSEWTAPEQVNGSEDVSIWVVQRDERGGLSWYETCVRVQP